MLILAIFLPIVAAILSFVLKQRRMIESVNVISQAVVMALTFVVGAEVMSNDFIAQAFFRLDALSLYVMGIVNVIGFVAILYSVGYIRKELHDGVIGMRRVRQYYALTQVFIFTMLFALSVDNLAYMWVAIEGTTLATAFLISFYNNEKTLEAAWKYLIICTVGITLALFGTFLVYYSSLQGITDTSFALDWSVLSQFARSLDPGIIKIAFIFILIGYGTKVGFVPMHTWLPDAHGRAPTPISALMSGVLLNVAFYSILRFKVITDQSLGSPHFTSLLFLIFGVASVVVSVLIILASTRYKRLLAYSSIEHMGLLAIGFGFAHPLATLGALWHMMNHALTKAMLFFAAGNTLQKYHTGKIPNVSGMISLLPVTALFLVIGVCAIVGFPPFGIFWSEIMMLAGGFASGHVLISVGILFALVVAFAGFFYRVVGMVFGEAPQGISPGEGSLWTTLPLYLLLGFMILFGFIMMPTMTTLLQRVQILLMPI